MAGGDALRQHLAENEECGSDEECREGCRASPLLVRFCSRGKNHRGQHSCEHVGEDVARQNRSQKPLWMLGNPNHGGGLPVSHCHDAQSVQPHRHEGGFRSRKEGRKDQYSEERRREGPGHERLAACGETHVSAETGEAPG